MVPPVAVGAGAGDAVPLVPGLALGLGELPAVDRDGALLRSAGVNAESPERAVRSNCAGGVPSRAPSMDCFQMGPGSEEPNTWLK